MKIIVTIILIFSCYYCYGQKRPFNCGLLVEIVKSMDIEKQKFETFFKIKGEFEYIEEGDGKYKVQPKTAYHKSAELDSILKLPDILEITDPHLDSIFYLQDYNVFLDTFKFFTPECNCKVNGKKIKVLNNVNKVPKSRDIMVIDLSGLDNYKGYSCIGLKYHGSHPKTYKVLFLYLIERNKHVVKKIEVVRRDMIDYDFSNE